MWRFTESTRFQRLADDGSVASKDCVARPGAATGEASVFCVAVAVSSPLSCDEVELQIDMIRELERKCSASGQLILAKGC